MAPAGNPFYRLVPVVVGPPSALAFHFELSVLATLKQREKLQRLT